MAPPLALIRLRFPLMLLAVVLISGAIGWVASSGGQPAKRASAPRHRAAGIGPLPNGWSYLAVAKSSTLAVYNRPAKHSTFTRFTRAVSAGRPLTVLVKQVGPHWLQVYLPTRPDGSTGWVHTSRVRLVKTSYSLVVQLESHRLLFDVAGRLFRKFKIGVGQSVTPTPMGIYYVTELLKQPDPNGLYGPYAFGTSAYSGVLKHFGQGGNGQIGIHGTNEPSLVGTDVSHGCIRLRNPDIVWLTKRLPLGTPVVIEHT